MIDRDFDGHPVRDFATLTADERLDELADKIALVLELRGSVVGSDTVGFPSTGELPTARG
ncbi:MAG TPA: hypothetical protein PKO15_13525 [Fibrobacteria bacterium]|nr:hypothetical protein [Fibrobacteria bacterium]HOX53066.1 hypothetical protein [Fibrobacteria bacterium]